VLEFNPGGGVLGAQPLFFVRGAYTVSPRLALEAEVGHNVGELVSGFLHSAGLRFHAFAEPRYAVFLGAGFGTFGVGEGTTLGAQSVTRSALRVGGGLIFTLRDDVGIRADLRRYHVLAIGGSTDGLGASEVSVGLVFRRRVWDPPAYR
jgi:hypothetical protein